MKKKICLFVLLGICAVLYAATGDESVVLTSSVERRNQEPNIKPVWELVSTWTYDTDDAGAETISIPINGTLQKIILTIPVTTTTGTTTQLLIKDNGDNTIFDSGEQAENDTYTFNVSEPLSGTIDIVIEPSAAAGTSGSAPVVTMRGI